MVLRSSRLAAQPRHPPREPRVGTPARRFGGFEFAGDEVARRVVRWSQVNDRVNLQSISFAAVADDSLPISHQRSQQQLLADPRRVSRSRRSRATARSYVIDVTDFFGGDTPGISRAQRRAAPAVSGAPLRSGAQLREQRPRASRSTSKCARCRRSTPPSRRGDRAGSTISLEMRQSMILLPKVPMRPRYVDQRVGFFTVTRINYGLDEQKAATEDLHHALAARAERSRGVRARRARRADQADRLLHRPGDADQMAPLCEGRRRVVAEGVREGRASRTPFSPRTRRRKDEDPDWDPDDARYSMVRWAASLVRNAMGPSTPDPRSGEIINSEIVWYHNHMRSYRNRRRGRVARGRRSPA